MSAQDINDHLVLISGISGTGKSASLKNIRNQERWLYLNTESNKRLPFPNKFQNFTIVNPYQIFEAFEYGKNNPEVEGIIIDSLTFLLDLFDTLYIQNVTDTRKAWNSFQTFIKELFHIHIASFGKPVILTAHVINVLNEQTGIWETHIPVKGAVRNTGIEAYVSLNIATKKISLKELEKYPNDLLVITERDKRVGYKHVFQTMITKETTGERIRGPMELFSDNETYIDNDVQKLLDRLVQYYN